MMTITNHFWFTSRKILTVLMILVPAVILAPTPTLADNASKAQKVVDKSLAALQLMRTGRSSAAINRLLTDAKGIMIFPAVIKVGIFAPGAERGNGILVSRDNQGVWSNPAFYRISSFSFGFQLGAQENRILLIFMSENALHRALDTKFKLGVDASITAVNIGADGELSTNTIPSDIYFYGETSKGIYGGISLEGSGVEKRKKLNRGYYGADATARAIVIARRFQNTGANDLVRDLNQAALARN